MVVSSKTTLNSVSPSLAWTEPRNLSASVLNLNQVVLTFWSNKILEVLYEASR